MITSLRSTLSLVLACGLAPLATFAGTVFSHACAGTAGWNSWDSAVWFGGAGTWGYSGASMAAPASWQTAPSNPSGGWHVQCETHNYLALGSAGLFNANNFLILNVSYAVKFVNHGTPNVKATFFQFYESATWKPVIMITHDGALGKVNIKLVKDPYSDADDIVLNVADVAWNQWMLVEHRIKLTRNANGFVETKINGVAQSTIWGQTVHNGSAFLYSGVGNYAWPAWSYYGGNQPGSVPATTQWRSTINIDGVLLTTP